MNLSYMYFELEMLWKQGNSRPVTNPRTGSFLSVCYGVLLKFILIEPYAKFEWLFGFWLLVFAFHCDSVSEELFAK